MKAYENLALIKGWMESPRVFPKCLCFSVPLQATTKCSLKTAGALDYQDLYNFIEAGCIKPLLLVSPVHAYHPIQQPSLCPSSPGKGICTLSYLNTYTRKYCIYMTKICLNSQASRQSVGSVFRKNKILTIGRETFSHSALHLKHSPLLFV